MAIRQNPRKRKWKNDKETIAMGAGVREVRARGVVGIGTGGRDRGVMVIGIRRGGVIMMRDWRMLVRGAVIMMIGGREGEGPSIMMRDRCIVIGGRARIMMRGRGMIGGRARGTRAGVENKI